MSCATWATSSWRKAGRSAAASLPSPRTARDLVLQPTSKIIEQAYIGKGRALDPDKYFIVVVNRIGNGLSSSPHNTQAPEGMANFPKVCIGDDVRAQHQLLTERGSG